MISKQDAVRGNFLFGEVEGADLEYAASLFEIKAFPLGKILFYEGTPREAFYQILRGKVEISKKEPSGRRRVSILSDGDCIGEGIFWDDSPHTTHAEALTDIEVLFLPKEKLSNLEKERRAAFLALKAGIAQQLSRRLKVSTSICADATQVSCRQGNSSCPGFSFRSRRHFAARIKRRIRCLS